MMYKLIRTKKQYIKQLSKLDSSKVLFCDTETCIDEGKTKGGLYGQVRLFQMYQEGMGYALIVDCRFVSLAAVLKTIKGFIHAYHNASYDLHTINCYTKELWLPFQVHDTYYLSKLALYKHGPRFDFYSCLDHAEVSDKLIHAMDKKTNQKADWSGVLTDTMLAYAAYDVLYLSLLWEKVKKRINTKAYKLDLNNLKYAVKYSRRGVKVDLERLQKKLLSSTNKYEKALSNLPVNPNSPKQVTEWLGTSSSDKDTLEKLTLEGNKDAGLVRKCRMLSKEVMFLNKYNRPIVKGFFNPCGAISGRFSCTGGDRFGHANLQQWAKRLLPIITAREGNVIVYSDYTGLELYMAVAWIGEPTMKKLLLEGVDVHTHTASAIYGIKHKDVTKEQRFVGKTCNFLLIYGGWHTVLQSTLRAWGGLLVSILEAQEIRKAWFKLYPGFAEWHNLNKKIINIYGYIDVSTALGRTVRCTKVNDALSVPVQGSSSEVTKKALEFMSSRYKNEYLINTIHDAIALECKEDQAKLWVDRLDECMQDAWFYVTKGLEVPDLPMPKGAEYNTHWEF